MDKSCHNLILFLSTFALSFLLLRWGLSIFFIDSSIVWTSISGIVAIMIGKLSLDLSSNWSLCNFFSTSPKIGFVDFILGNYLSPAKCKIDWHWKEPQVVGTTVSFTILFFKRNGISCPIYLHENIMLEITHNGNKIAYSVEVLRTEHENENKAKVQFCARRAGEYIITVMASQGSFVHIHGSPFRRNFLPGPSDSHQTGFIHHSSTVVCTQEVPYHLFIELRDKYGNLCKIEDEEKTVKDFKVEIVHLTSNCPISNAFFWDVHKESSRVGLILKFTEIGLYKGSVYFRDSLLKNGELLIVNLNDNDASLVAKNVRKNKTITYEAKLILLNNEQIIKPKKICITISPKQLTIKEFILKIIPKRLATFRLCPSTKFHFTIDEKFPDLKDAPIVKENKLLIIDDGSQFPVGILSEERAVIAATFSHFLMKNIGGSETFKDKQDFFYHEVRKFHAKNFHERYPILIQRDRVLDSSMKVTKGFSVADWCKNFEVMFIGEEALDWGGVRREWVHLLCRSLFDPNETELFMRFKNDKQGLAHPNPRRSPHLKLKLYEFAGKIVGKCLYESALGSGYRQLVNARFTRSFLAQLIGLRVHYRYFEQDDPDLYISKIKYILEHDVSEMELFFTEEEYDSHGTLIRDVDLIPNGSKIPVTNTNKIQYLDALAQYRLATSVKEEIEYFLKGLNDLIPDNLLAIFDENELELLICGTGQYPISELRAHHIASGTSFEFKKVLDWFWSAISNFTDEEMARLLQFTTGCSQLPAGGFAELNPKFHITSSPTFDMLPTAHTCFNQLCLPDYDSYDQFERALRIAIYEGSEGFGMI